MTNLLEQACNHFLKEEAFPTSYAQMQEPPMLSVGCLTFAGDDGMMLGQTYRARIDLVTCCDLSTRRELHQATLALRLRSPDEQGKWGWTPWVEKIPLPETLYTYLEQRAVLQAPTLRELRQADGERVAVLDLILEVPARLVFPLEQERRVLGWDWGVRSLITVSILELSEDWREKPDAPFTQLSRPLFLDTGGLDGRQARLRREIDRLKACKERYERLISIATRTHQEKPTPLPAEYDGWLSRVRGYEERIAACWHRYERRNRELAHLASNLLILLALIYDCHLICGENLSTLKTIGRGRGVRGRFRNWRNNSMVRGELWRVLKYKCHLLGIRTRQVEPRGTTHTCPRCHEPAKTYASPAARDRKKAIDWGPFLCCANPDCRWSGARDYAASLNIARLGLAFLRTALRSSRYTSYRMADASVNPCSYTGQGALLLLRVQGINPCPIMGKQVYYAGWIRSMRLCTSQTTQTLSLLSASQLRKTVLLRA
ncbi:zinc ribbon domain-containing protein [Ktedonosporobacter rubrisoli]|uniref:zinc ribbon domain-containing protein n=1 Tax=Ktedonosporobacter rubrisoli TaxID=2509675 RepID=UPI001F5CE10C|nr:zinc ribbon domain-containing protein [Ktedonosporobacter rubrisoli]